MDYLRWKENYKRTGCQFFEHLALLVMFVCILALLPTPGKSQLVHKKLYISDLYATDGSQVDDILIRWRGGDHVIDRSKNQYMLASRESNIGLYLQNTKSNKWTEVKIPVHLWYASPNKDYSFKVAVKKHSDEITNLCWGSLYTYFDLQDEIADEYTFCEQWVDPRTPSYVLEIFAQGSFYFHYDYTPNYLDFLSVPYLGLLELGASFSTKGDTDSENQNCNLINDGCLAEYPDDWW